MGFSASLTSPSEKHLGNGVISNTTPKPNKKPSPSQQSTTVNVEGMTCNSCVSNIEEVVGEKSGVIEIKVSLAEKKASIVYDPTFTDPETLRSHIDDMGFEASLPQAQTTKKPSSSSAEVVISVKGMTCNSCVNNIEGTIGEKPGVKSIKVSLEKKEAVIQYDANVISPPALRDAINDMGFEASLPIALEFDPLAQGKEQSAPPIKATESVVIDIEGMTCQSCVDNIEDVVSGIPGVGKIKVSLSEKHAVIGYDPTITNPSTLKDRICDMGFEAKITIEEDFDEIARRNAEKNKSMNGICVIGINGMTCHSCVDNIEDVVGNMPGVNNIKVMHKEGLSTVNYNRSVTDPYIISERIEDMGFEAHVLAEPSVRANALKVPSLINKSPGNAEMVSTLSVKLKGMRSSNCVSNITEALSGLVGVLSVKVILLSQTCDVVFNPSNLSQADIIRVVEGIGYKVLAEGGTYVFN